MLSYIIKCIFKIGFWVVVFFFVCLSMTLCSGNPRANDINNDIKCLASTIYHEARGEPQHGQIAVGKVVMNRVNHKTEFPNEVCHVIKQKNQFSWVNGKKYVPIKYTKKEIDIAKKVYYNHHHYNHIVSNDTLFFQTKHIKNNWATKRLVKSKVIGNHVFFKYPTTKRR